MEIQEPFNPLNKKNLGLSVAEALLQKSISSLPPTPFSGAGIYAIYYAGDFAEYKTLSEANSEDEWSQPIYVGKAIPAGARRGGVGLDAPPGTVLFNRLREHASSILSASATLRLQDFRCRYLIVDDIWIPLGESLLIEMFRPLWNVALDGFGNHTPGAGRFNQARSPWDVLHPGREWAERCAPGRNPIEIVDAVRRHFSTKA